uniref:Uncharacterized protein n=1 Tax=Hyaloperonospora arabidopsidis (strain Emoy2) TaxID=559515 RepID=M4B6Q9_HYAAE
MVERDACFAAEESMCRRLPRRSRSSSNRRMLKKCCSRWSSHLTRTSKFGGAAELVCIRERWLKTSRMWWCAQSHPVH